MLKILQTRSNFFYKKLDKNFFKRHFLSNEYKCSDIWENRLKNPAFAKIDFEDLYHQLDLNFKAKEKINILDIDLFFNTPKGNIFKNEIEDVLLKFRLCPECVLFPDRTMHAAIRWFMDNVPPSDLLSILGDRIHYGLFPDYQLTNMLMDNYLKNKDAVSAVKVAVLQMLQEDFDHPITKALALYSCYNYLTSSDVWEGIKEIEEDPEEETTKIRVKFLRNPYYDDHFDIDKPNLLIGKTLHMLGENIEDALGTSSKLIGLIMHEKYEKCYDFLENIIKNNNKVHADAVTKAKEWLMGNPKKVKEVNSEIVGEQSSETSEDPEKAEKSETKEVPDERKTKILELLSKVPEKNLVQGDILLAAEEWLKKTIAEHEKKDIEMHCQVYKQWEKDRDELIKEEIKRDETEKLVSEIERVKKELSEEEEKLFFFEKEEELDMLLEEKEKEMQEIRYYKPRRKSKENVADEYIPPDVTQKKN